MRERECGSLGLELLCWYIYEVDFICVHEGKEKTSHVPTQFFWWCEFLNIHTYILIYTYILTPLYPFMKDSLK